MPQTIQIDRAKLDALMTRQCLDFPELARRSGVHVLTMRRVANGRQMPRRATIRKLATALAVEPGEITKEES